MNANWQTFLNNQVSLFDEKPTLFYLSSYGLLKVSGVGAKKLLQGQLTCDIEKTTDNIAILGAHCNPQGRIISLFHLFLIQENYYLLMLRSMIPIALHALKKYAVFYQVELKEVSKQYVMIASLNEIQSFLPQSKTITIPSSKPYQLIITEADISKDIEKLQVSQAIWLNENEWKWQMISHKIPLIYPNTSSLFLPHDIQLPTLGAISFDKGCYTGQEIIARMHYRGKLKNHLYRASMIYHAPPTIGSDIHYLQNQEMRSGGTIVDYCYRQYDNYQVLIVTDQLNAKDNHLFLNNHPCDFFKIID